MTCLAIIGASIILWELFLRSATISLIDRINTALGGN
jgi:hypothetical protein